MPQRGTIAPDGTPVLRRLLPEDRGALSAHLLALSPFDRIARWNGARSDAGILEDCARLDLSAGSSRAVAVGAVAPDGLIGAAICAWLPGLGAEMAVTVAAPWRRLGLGTALLRLAWAEARSALGAEWALLEAEAENIPMHRLRQRLSGEIPLRPAAPPDRRGRRGSRARRPV